MNAPKARLFCDTPHAVDDELSPLKSRLRLQLLVGRLPVRAAATPSSAPCGLSLGLLASSMGPAAMLAPEATPVTGVSPAVDALASGSGHAEMLETHHRLTPTLSKGYSPGGLGVQGEDMMNSLAIASSGAAC